MATRRIELRNAKDTEALGTRIAAASPPGICVHLHGELAAGKTTFARGYLRGLGYHGAVKSPTFTLVESYDLDSRRVHHFDLYRLAHAAELDFVGIDEYFVEGTDCLVEWAERGAGSLPSCDLEIRLEVVDAGRAMTLKSHTERGFAVISRIFKLD